MPNAVMSGSCGTDLIGIMLEFHKRTYCDGEGRSVPEKLDVIREIIRQVIVDCVEL